MYANPSQMVERANKKLGLERAMNADRSQDGLNPAAGKPQTGPPQVSIYIYTYIHILS